jgi:diguanylate cyclase (GGDEF)-like protein/PAS domain S-box-containing protein
MPRQQQEPPHPAAGPSRLERLLACASERRLDADELDRGLALVLATHPGAPVGALTETGVYAPMPPSIDVDGRSVLAGRSGLDGASDEDRAGLLANWDRVLANGASRCMINPGGYGATFVYCLDLRERHGVVFVLLDTVAGDAGDPRPASEPEGVAPRFATIAKDQFSTITHVDEAVRAILGWQPEEMVGRRTLEFVHADDHALAVDNWMQMLARPGPARRVRQRLLRRDGSWAWFEITNHNLLEDPDHGCVVSEMVDITDEMAAHDEIRAREQLLHRLAETVPVGLLQIDAEGTIVYTNDRLHEILGAGRAATVRAQLVTLVPGDRRRAAEAAARVIRAGGHADVEVAVRNGREGERFCTFSLRALTREDGSVSGAIGCVADVTEGTRMREELRRRAAIDDLTGCHNRASIMGALEEHVASGRREAERAVLYIDLDAFKQLNDRYGHAAGDELLHAVGAALRAAVRERDLVGRLGGDEFLVLCPDVQGPRRARALGRRIERRLAELAPASVGVAWSRGRELAAEHLVAAADRAMYASKRRKAQLAGEAAEASSRSSQRPTARKPTRA